MAETLTIRTASSTEVVKIAVPGPQGPKGDKGDPGDVAGLPLSTQGDTLYRGASENQRLPIGTSGQILKVSAGGIPEWANESGAVSSVAGKTGVVTLDKNDVGLGNVANTAQVTSVTGTAPIVSSGGTTPAISVTVGTTANTVCAGNDARLSDSRTPTAHAAAHASSGSDPLFDQDLNTADNVTFNEVTTDNNLTVGGDLIVNNAVSIGDNGIDFTPAGATATIGYLGLGTAATADIGTGSTEVAAGDHTHGNITNDGKVGSDSGRVLVTTTAGAVTTLALGTAGQVLTVNSGATGVEFAAASGGGVSSVSSSASDVLGVSGSDITGVDANADRIVYWNNTSNKLAYGTPADAGAAAASHTHAASDVTSGTFDNARINFAAPAAIGGTTPSTGAFTSLSTAPAANTSALTTTGYSLTGSNAQSLVDLAGTWNTTGTPSAIKLNITDTASNASSLLMQLQTDGTNRLTVSKAGLITTSDRIRVGDGSDAAPSYSFVNGTTSGFRLDSGVPRLLGYLNNTTIFVITSSNIQMQSTQAFGWTNGGAGTTADALLRRDSAGVIAQYNGTNAQEKRLYGTYSSASNYQRMTVKSVKQTLSALSGASATTTGTFIPDGAVVVGVTTRVATALTGATGYTIGDGTDADRYGDITGTAIGTTSDNRDWTAGTIECFTAGGEITLTAKTSNFTAGAIEVCVFYLAGEAD